MTHMKVYHFSYLSMVCVCVLRYLFKCNIVFLTFHVNANSINLKIADCCMEGNLRNTVADTFFRNNSFPG